MAFIKKGTRQTKNLTERDSIRFDLDHGPKEKILYAGIYRCDICGHEILRAQSSHLPPKDKAKNSCDHKWKLFVALNGPFNDASVLA